MNTSIVIKAQVEGIHAWLDAKEKMPEVAFLSDPHRHIFHITCKAQVHHDDRDIEIIMFKREIVDYLKRIYFNTDINMLDFKGMSCEMIAKDLVETFNLSYCEVLEDGENGALVTI